MLLAQLRRHSLKPLAQVRKFSGGSYGPPPPSFVRLPAFAADKVLPENYDLLWHDGVAPELQLDFDAQQISQASALLWFLGGLAAFGSVFVLTWLRNPSQSRKAAPRILPDVDEALGPYPRKRQKYDPDTLWFKPKYY